MQKILEWIDRFASGKHSKKFWAIVIILCVLVMIVYPYIDANYFYYNRIEKRIDILQSLVDLTGNPIENDESLKAEYESILSEVSSARNSSIIQKTKHVDSEMEHNVKFLSAFALWGIVGVVLLFSKPKDGKRTFKKFMQNVVGVLVCIMIGIVCGKIFALIPTIYHYWINAIIAPVVELTVAWLFMK